ncbi:hypothetical protein ES288_A01G204700v1 [Gossypium darwinii]|uniref:Uncharacterized protein isoform X2 n=2 Tax=Gossypium TaxID=3633 RepID=A0ABM3BP87_GOSHI|nr:uncharacterized protein LOC107925407 isoform X2 [Gossypium hirsutum]TYH31851.1 hypothetical protein ES288_A01G204700v1 [Gossypium darwinii]
MSTEAAKRSTTGALTMKQWRTDELKPSPALTAEPKKVIIKSTDMKDDMRKEAVNIAISVIMFEEHCNIENLGRVNKVKVKKRITVKSLQLEPLCNQHGEVLQVLHYEVGQKYEPYHDYFCLSFLLLQRTQKLSISLTHLSRMGSRWHQFFILIAAMSKHFLRGYVGIHSSGFRDFLPKPELLRSIVDSGFEHPSEGKVLNSCLMLTFVNSMN